MNVRHTASSVRPVVEGMGALADARGLRPRVWAPHAEGGVRGRRLQRLRARRARAAARSLDGYWYGFVEAAPRRATSTST
ncbi:MAG: hypothetical protein MZW92_23125 [Comamonadaceae bacterium]|nr:hypothetical protein [Comamonadaceae bacterium]